MTRVSLVMTGIQILIKCQDNAKPQFDIFEDPINVETTHKNEIMD